jgi:hypothetical protein
MSQNWSLPLVQPSGDEKPLLTEMIEEKEAPILKSVGFGQLAPGNFWVSYLITTQGDKVLSIQVSDPDLRQIAEDSAKIAFVTELMDKTI